MIDALPAGAWTVDLSAHLATRGSIRIRFAERAEHGFDIAFVGAPQCGLEEQCLIAGQAVEAIEAKLLQRGRYGRFRRHN